MTAPALDTVLAEIRALRDLGITQVQRRYAEVLGKPTKSFNGAIRYTIARRLAEEARGLASTAADRRRLQRALAEVKAPRPAPTLVQPDPRIPPLGSVLKKRHGDQEIVVKVLRDGFRYRDRVYRSLSAIAREVTGARWNGVLWFDLRPRQRGARRKRTP